jgi:hypothetical protein
MSTVRRPAMDVSGGGQTQDSTGGVRSMHSHTAGGSFAAGTSFSTPSEQVTDARSAWSPSPGSIASGCESGDAAPIFFQTRESPSCDQRPYPFT